MPLPRALELAQAKYRDGDPAQADFICRKILDVVPNQPDAMHLLGLGEMKRGNLATALRCLARASDAGDGPGADVRRSDLARALETAVVVASRHVQDNRPADGAALCRAILELVPDRPEVLHALALAERLLGMSAVPPKGEQGFTLAMRAHALVPGDHMIASSLSRLAVDAANTALDHYNNNRREQALALFARVVRTVPAHADIHWSFAAVLRGIGRNSQAIAVLRRVLELDPAHVRALAELGAAASEESRWAVSAGAFRRLHALDPGHGSADFRHRIALGALAAAQGFPEGFAANKVLALRHDHYLNWQPSAELIRHSLPLPEPNPPILTYDYDAYYRSERLPHTRRIHPDNPSSCCLLERAQTDVFYVPYFSGTAFGWLTTIAQHGDTASNGGTPTAMINRLYRKLIAHTPSNTILADLADCRRYDHDDDEPVVYLDNYMNYGHWLIDHLPTLQFAERGGISERCKLFLPAINRWQAMSLLPLGYGERIISTDWSPPRQEHVQHHRFRNLWFCGAPPIRARVEYLRQKLLPAAQGRFDLPRIFITRRGRPSTRMKNEPEVIRFLEDRGFHMLAPEEFSFFEQIAIFSQARVVVSATGSAYANLVFCPRDAVYIELTSRSMFDVVKESFDHYDMFPALGMRHIPLLHDSQGLPGVFPEETGFTVDFDQLDKVLQTL